MTTTTTQIPAGTWVLDPAHSEVGFTVRHIMSRVRGRFNEFEGSIVTGESLADSSATADITLASIDTRQEQRDEHLRSADFFDAGNNVHMTFRSTNVKDNGDELIVTGDLSIKGVTRSIDLQVEVLGVDQDPWGGTRIGIEASGQLSRREFGIDFNIPLEGDKVMIGDKISIVITAEGVLQQS
ncbi:MAG TPA: YceI family protein [Nocardioidaceae bacterium]|nr:YceI family protein [Nocardioidaceae bacterium]